MPTQPIWHAAADFAARQHHGQLRKDGVTPYISHPFRVAMVVQALFGLDDPEALAAAVLHDTLEDTRTDYEDLLEAFGPWVTQAVATLSDNKSLPKEERIDDYHRRLAGAEPRVLIVKLADAYDNFMDSLPPRGDPSLHAKTRRKGLRLLDALRHRRGDHPALTRAFSILEETLGPASAAGTPSQAP